MIPALAAEYTVEAGLLTIGPVTDETNTIRPRPDAMRAGSAALVTANGMRRFWAMPRSHSSSVIARTSVEDSPSSPTATIPALLTRMSSRPCAARTSSTSAAAAPGTVRSPTWPDTTTPASVASSRTRSWIRAVVEAMASAAPPPARIRAVAKPIPCGPPAPVTSATRPAKRPSATRRPSAAVAVAGRMGPPPGPGGADHLGQRPVPGLPAERRPGPVRPGDEDRRVALAAGADPGRDRRGRRPPRPPRPPRGR